MLVSLIIAVYKDVKALELILDTLTYQTYENFEVVVAEDGQSNEMKVFIQKARDRYSFTIKHTTQEDIGVRKARSQNNAILAASGEYLIFIDGDCIPYKNFIEGHMTLAQDRCVLTGRRLNIPIKLANKIKEKSISVLDIEEHPWRYIHLIFKKGVRFRQGIYLNPKGLVYKIFSKRDIATSILGCNFSCFKNDMMLLNGFDESYGETAIPDDMDWEWRFKAYGLELKSCKNVANMFHLDHKIHNRGDATPYLKTMFERKKAGKYVCEDGLNTHV